MLEQRADSGVVQPTVCVLTGDVNLSKNVATALVQPDVGEPDLLKHWHTEASNAAKSGDVAFVKGTASKAWDVSIGASYEDRGMRKDSHDFFGMTLNVPLVQVPSSPMLPPMPTTNIPTEPGKAEHSASASSGAPQIAFTIDLKEDWAIDEGKAEASRDAGNVQKRTSDTGITEEGTAATSSGVPQPAAAEATEDRRSWKREREWDNAALPGRGPRNALTYNVAEGILKDMRRWYEERLDGEDVSVAVKHLHPCLFNTVTVPLNADIGIQTSALLSLRTSLRARSWSSPRSMWPIRSARS